MKKHTHTTVERQVKGTAADFVVRGTPIFDGLPLFRRAPPNFVASPPVGLTEWRIVGLRALCALGVLRFLSIWAS